MNYYNGQPISRQDEYEFGIVKNCRRCGEECGSSDLCDGLCFGCQEDDDFVSTHVEEKEE